MSKHIFILLLLLVSLGCGQNLNLERKDLQVNSPVFMSKIEITSDTDTVSALSKDFENAFSLPPISKSKETREVRIYYANVFFERFFREVFTGDSVKLDLYDCKTDRKNDSIFMQINKHITATGKASNSRLLNTSILPGYLLSIAKDTVADLDNGFVFFIQTKNFSEQKNILLNHNSSDSSSTFNFIHQLQDKYNFTLYDSWKSIDSFAFKKL